MLVYRFAKLQYLSDLSGIGAKTYGGRWNNKGNAVVYTSGSAALAMLEFACNDNNKIKTEKTGLLTLEISNQLKIETVSLINLPDNWQMIPGPDMLKRIGDSWLRSGKSLALKVPSAIVPIEFNYLINPMHKDFSGIESYINPNFIIDKRINN